MKTVIELIPYYFIVNALSFGFYCGWTKLEASDRKERMVHRIYMMSLLLFGTIFVIGAVIWCIIEPICIFLEGYFQISFWYRWIFTKYYNDTDSVNEGGLQNMNYIALKMKNTQKINHRIYRHCVGLVNKRYNFVYEESKHE